MTATDDPRSSPDSRPSPDRAGASAAAKAAELGRAERGPLLLKAAAAGILGGIVAGFLAGPWAGLALGLVLALVLALVLRRRGAAARWRKGAVGERRTARRLDRIRGARVLHDRSIPGSRANLDHVVVCGAGVVVVDSKQRSGPVRVGGRSGWVKIGKTGGPLLVKAVLWETEQVSRVLSDATGRRVEAMAVLSVHGAKLPTWRTIVVNGVPVLRARDVPAWLRSRPRRLSASEVDVLADVLAERFPAYTRR